MKRCPECGFRAIDHTCPLCGVRMRDLPGESLERKTHVHRQQGEQCVLPNQKPERKSAPGPQPKRETAGDHANRWRTSRSTAPINPKVWQTVLLVIIVILFRACTA